MIDEYLLMIHPLVLGSGRRHFPIVSTPELPRWHEGRLWFCHWLERQVVAVGLDGHADQAANEIVVDDRGNIYFNGQVAGEIELPNGMAFTPDNGTLIIAESLAADRAPFTLMLGGPDRRTRFICTVEWRPADGRVASLSRLTNGPRAGQILAIPVSVPGDGRP